MLRETIIYANTLDDLDKMNKFLETYNLPKLNQEESESLKRQIIPSGIEVVIKKLPTILGLNSFTSEF